MRNLKFIPLALLTAILFTGCGTKKSEQQITKEENTTIIGMKHNEDANASSEHLTFRGIPIDGTAGEFIKKLEALGYTYVKKDDEETYLLRGEFAGRNNCQIVVNTDIEEDLVCVVAVILPPCDAWKKLESDYLGLKNMLTKEYGEPYDYLEVFKDYEPMSDEGKIQAIRKDEYHYTTTFLTEKGEITVKIMNLEGDCSAGLMYRDRINSEDF